MKKLLLLIFTLFPILNFAQTPQWDWAKTHTLTGNSSKLYTATDVSGNVYTAGNFASVTMTIGGVTLNNHETTWGLWDIYLAKYTPEGELIWARNYGSENTDSVISITTDQAGNLYLLGTFQTSITLGDTTLTTVYPSSFVAKLDADGNVLWAKSNSDDTYGWTGGGIAVDLAGNVYFSGVYNSDTITFGSFVLSYANFSATEQNVAVPFVVKLDANGETVWAKGANRGTANTGTTFANGVAADNQGNVFITGSFSIPTLDFGGVTLTKALTSNWNHNMFLVKFNADGTTAWGKNSGSNYTNVTMGYDVATDNQGNVFNVGVFANTVTWDGMSLSASSGNSAYFLKYDTNGVIQWAKSSIGTFEPNHFRSVKTDANGNIYICGNTGSLSENFGNNVVMSASTSAMAYLVKYNANGTAAWVQKTGKIDSYNSTSFAILDENEFYLAGTFTENQVSFGSISLAKNAATNYNLFLAHMKYVPLEVNDFDVSDVVLYPNPTKNNLHVSGVDAFSRFEISDILGRRVKKGQLSESNGIDVSELPSGAYQIRIINQDGTKIVRKFAKD